MKKGHLPEAPTRNYAPDIIAGLSIAGLLLPEAVAYSGIANLPPQAGIVGLIAGLAGYGLLGTSRFAIVAATSSSAAVLAAATASIASGNDGLRLGLAAGLVLLAGVYFLTAAAARLGQITDFIARPVLRGFAFGLALVIVARQTSAIAGVHATGGDIFRYVLSLVGQAGQWHHASIQVGLAALMLLFVLGSLPRVPGGLIVIALGIAATRMLDLEGRGVHLVGPIHLALPVPSVPDLDRAEWLRLGEIGVALVLVLYSESYGAIRSFAIKHGDAVEPNRDLLALGVSNVLSGFLCGMPVGAGYSATSANESAGARSRAAGLVALLLLIAVTALVLPEIALTPEPVLAAIVIHAVSHSLKPEIFRPYFTWHRDRLVAVASVIAVLWLGVLDGLLASIAISLVMMLLRLSVSTVVVLGRLGASHDFLNIADHRDAQPVPGILVLRPDEPLFFANVERVLIEARRRISGADAGVHTVILSLEESYDLDSTSVEALDLFFAWVAAQDRHLILARLKHPVHELLKLVVTKDAAAPVMIGLSVDDAVTIALERAR
jgi:MFS superfamily sulfate permease-like transporter